MQVDVTVISYRLAASLRVPTPVHAEPEEEEELPCNTVIALPKITRWAGLCITLELSLVEVFIVSLACICGV